MALEQFDANIDHQNVVFFICSPTNSGIYFRNGSFGDALDLSATIELEGPCY